MEKILDANMILRFLLNDNIEMSDKVNDLIEKSDVLILPEVVAEVVYVMKNVYKLNRQDISSGLLTFLDMDHVKTNCGNVLYKGIKVYSKTPFDFVDCLLYAYHTVSGYEVMTFDKKLNNLIKRSEED